MKEIQNKKINYKQLGKGKDIVLLHGWGQNYMMMMPLVLELQKTHRVTLIDLPGFGESEEPDKVLRVYDYAEIIYDLVKTLKLKKPSLIGHSFGGKIAMVYASKYETDKLVLFGSPCFASPKEFSLKTKLLKKAKTLPFIGKFENIAKKYIGSSDYKKASPIMREILVDTVNTDISESAKKIKSPTLIIWGDKDEAVPLSDAQKLETIIDDSALIILENASHYAYLEHIAHVRAILKEFF